MSILVRYQPDGLTREQYDEVNRRMGEAEWPPDGLLVHVMFGDEGSMRVSEVWESEDRWRAFTERLFPVLRDAGVDMSREPELLPVHNLDVLEAATRS